MFNNFCLTHIIKNLEMNNSKKKTNINILEPVF